MSILSKFVRKAAPIVATVAPFVGGAGVAVGAAAGAIATNEARRKQQAQEREITGMELFGNQTM